MKTASQTTKATICPVCRGKKTVQKNGKTTVCQRCRGTGHAGGYSTK